MNCTKCGTANLPGESVCKSCGTALTHPKIMADRTMVVDYKGVPKLPPQAQPPPKTGERMGGAKLSGEANVKSGSGFGAIGLVIAIIALLAVGGVTFWIMGEMKKVNAELGSLRQTVEQQKTTMEIATSKLANTDKAVEDFKTQITDTKNRMDAMDSRANNGDKKFSDLKMQVDELQIVLDKLAANKDIKNVKEQLEEAMKKAADEFNKLEGRINGMESELKKLKE